MALSVNTLYLYNKTTNSIVSIHAFMCKKIDILEGVNAQANWSQFMDLARGNGMYIVNMDINIA